MFYYVLIFSACFMLMFTFVYILLNALSLQYSGCRLKSGVLTWSIFYIVYIIYILSVSQLHYFFKQLIL